MYSEAVSNPATEQQEFTTIKIYDIMATKQNKLEALAQANGFIKTSENVTFTFSGWDGKSYNGEGQTKPVYTKNSKRFVLAYSAFYHDYFAYELIGKSHPVSGFEKVRFHSILNK